MLRENMKKIGTLSLNYEMLGSLVMYGLPALGMGCIAVLLLLGAYGFLALSIYMVIPMVLAPALYLLYREKRSGYTDHSDNAFKLAVTLYLVLFSASVILVYLSEVRPIVYYVAIAAMATTILLEILLFTPNRVRVGAILLQIAALTLNLIWNVNLKYPFFIGRTDMAVHAWLVENVLKYGHVTQIFDLYQAFPLWHIFSSAAYLIAGMTGPAYTIMFIACGLVYALTIYTVYCLAKKITGDTRYGLMAALFTSFYPFFILQGTEPMARSITGCLLPVLLLLFLGSRDRRNYPLAILLTLGVIIFHTVSILFFLVIMFLLYLTVRVFGSKHTFPLLDLRYFVISIAMTAAYWMLAAGNVVQLLLFNINTPPPTGIMTQSVVQTPLNELFNYLQYMPLLLLIILGVLIALRSDKMKQSLKVFSVVALALIPLTFPGPLLLLNKLNSNLGIDRFYENGYLFMNLAAALGLMLIFFRSGKRMKAVVVLLFAVLVLLSVSNDFVATDNPLVKRPFFTHYLKTSEMAGLNLISEMANANVLVDYPAWRYLNSSDIDYMPLILSVNKTSQQFISPARESPMIVRKAKLETRPLDVSAVDNDAQAYGIFVPDNSLTYYNLTSQVWNDLQRFSKVYDSNTIDGYY